MCSGTICSNVQTNHAKADVRFAADEATKKSLAEHKSSAKKEIMDKARVAGQKMLQEKEQANIEEENKDNGKTGQRRQSTPTAAAAAVPKKEAPKPTISPSKAPNDNSADSNVSENTLSGAIFISKFSNNLGL